MFGAWSRRLISTLVAAVLIAGPGSGNADKLRVADAGDVLSMDPHSLNETFQLTFLNNVYEPLIGRSQDMSLWPLLATRWAQTSPTVWRFELRRGVRFHDGTPFDADDVVFSFERAAGAGSDLKGVTSPIKQVRKVDAFTVDIETDAPFPTLPDAITTLYILNRKWCEENKAEQPADRRKREENTASFKANGTGPYRLKERQPGTRTDLVRNSSYWGKIQGNVDEVVFTPISNAATRVAALVSGEVDLIQPVPLQDIAYLKARGLTVLQGPELRVIFLGMDQKRDELLYSNVKGRNPFKDRRVRQAFYQAIDIEAIRSRVMYNAAIPTAQLVASVVRGYQPEMKRLPHDVEAAKRLLVEAGYPNGFEVLMNCPNDRYVQGEAVCVAIAANLSRIGVKINLQVESKSLFFPKILRRDTSLYILSWIPITLDSYDAMYNLMATPTDKGQGQFNLGAYSNPKFDELTAKVKSELDDKKRSEYIREAFRLHADDIGHIPLYQQTLAWGFNRNVRLVQPPNNGMYFGWMSLLTPDAERDGGGTRR